jgi:hypothetical protein
LIKVLKRDFKLPDYSGCKPATSIPAGKDQTGFSNLKDCNIRALKFPEWAPKLQYFSI